ncbi:Mitochondrial zinc maintenance protein 1, mitochondrial [Tolypocladium ophioglossoides CBS 100239]|uniref:Mitochondrial zinc maintenance protein 1, mitochondrial n=1 Tax=Tolypocladium ophioglossoides (strain CBS 100239) TaxID=1163406 RepID=A0A0L0NFC1_TOLOC|nr:Mitochondrial zinc maintenance protein 1, mitochondrial [Tolypocladium ophioglossoides CBS 100239]
MALVAYRNLMRAARIAFKGDAPVLAAAQVQIRHEFRQKSSLESSSADSEAAIQHAEEVARILRENVVQGRKAEGQQDTYSEQSRHPTAIASNQLSD